MNKKEFIKQFDAMVKDETRTCINIFEMPKGLNRVPLLIRVERKDFEQIKEDIMLMCDKDMIVCDEVEGEAVNNAGSQIIKLL